MLTLVVEQAVGKVQKARAAAADRSTAVMTDRILLSGPLADLPGAAEVQFGTGPKAIPVGVWRPLADLPGCPADALRYAGAATVALGHALNPGAGDARLLPVDVAAVLPVALWPSESRAPSGAPPSNGGRFAQGGTRQARADLAANGGRAALVRALPLCYLALPLTVGLVGRDAWTARALRATVQDRIRDSTQAAARVMMSRSIADARNAAAARAAVYARIALVRDRAADVLDVLGAAIAPTGGRARLSEALVQGDTVIAITGAVQSAELLDPIVTALTRHRVVLEVRVTRGEPVAGWFAFGLTVGLTPLPQPAPPPMPVATAAAGQAPGASPAAGVAP